MSARAFVLFVLLARLAGSARGGAEPDTSRTETEEAPTVGFPSGEADSGAWGRFFRVVTTAEPTTLEAEEPFTFTVRVTTPERAQRPPRRIDLNDIPAFAERFYILDEDE